MALADPLLLFSTIVSIHRVEHSLPGRARLLTALPEHAAVVAIYRGRRFWLLSTTRV